MKTITATEAKSNFGDLLMSAQSGPVTITRNGKEQGVLLSAKEYKEIKIHALQAAITAGIESGDAGILDMEEIKQEAKRRARLNAKN